MTTINPSRPALSPPARPPVPSAPSGAMATPAIDPLKLLQKYKWLLGISVIAGILLGSVAHVVLLRVYPIYSSTVLFECLPVETELATLGLVTHKDDLEKFQATQVQILLSDETIDSTIRNARLQTEAPKWYSRFVSGGNFNSVRASTSLRRNLSAGIVGESNFVRMTFRTTDADEAAAIAQLLRRTYMDGRLRAAQSEIGARKDTIQAQIRLTDDDIRRVQRDRDALLQNRSIDALEAAVNSASRQLELADEKLSAISVQKEDLQVHLAQLENELQSSVGINYSDTIRKRVDDDLEIINQKHRINMLDSELIALSQRVGPTHRDRVRLESMLRSARQVLEERTEVLLRQAFDAQLDALRTMLRSTQAQEAEQLALREQARLRAIEFTQVKQQVKDHDQTIAGLTDTRASFSESLRKFDVTTSGSAQTRVKLHMDARRPREVSFPKIYVMIPAALFLVLGVVGGLVLLVEVIDQRVKSPADIAMIPRTRVMGLIPHSSEDPAAPAKIETVFRDQPGGVLAEQFRQLRGGVLKRMQQGGHKSLVVMSGLPESGATSVVINLGLSLAAAEHRVLIVDANFRRPSVHKHLGLPESPGLADLLAGTRSLSEATTHTEDKRLHVLTAGSPDNRMFERLGTDAMGDLLRDASSLYDIILIDVAPAIVAGDAIAVANRADASLLVVRAMGEKRGMVARLRNDLSDSRAEFLGVLVNAVRSSAGGYLRGNMLATHNYRGPKSK